MTVGYIHPTSSKGASRPRGGGLRGRRRAAIIATLCSILTGLWFASADAAVGSQPECTNESLRSALDLTLLPNCRAYEMVSPPYKEGYPTLVVSVAASGDSAILSSLGALA